MERTSKNTKKEMEKHIEEGRFWAAEVAYLMGMNQLRRIQAQPFTGKSTGAFEVKKMGERVIPFDTSKIIDMNIEVKINGVTFN